MVKWPPRNNESRHDLWSGILNVFISPLWGTTYLYLTGYNLSYILEYQPNDPILADWSGVRSWGQEIDNSRLRREIKDDEKIIVISITLLVYPCFACPFTQFNANLPRLHPIMVFESLNYSPHSETTSITLISWVSSFLTSRFSWQFVSKRGHIHFHFVDFCKARNNMCFIEMLKKR